VNRWHRASIWVAAVYLLFYLGGRWSFLYTHDCVRHVGDTCDSYENDKRWTALDPIRAVHVGWMDTAVLVGIAVVVGAWYWRKRRRKSH
jgi:hypothetical protein